MILVYCFNFLDIYQNNNKKGSGFPPLPAKYPQHPTLKRKCIVIVVQNRKQKKLHGRRGGGLHLHWQYCHLDKFDFGHPSSDMTLNYP